MNTIMRVIAVAAALGGNPDGARVAPKEIQLWNAGPNPTDYGVHVWSTRSISAVLERYGDRGNPILVDAEHNGSTLKDGEPAVTAGYARLEVRAGAPWLVFEWSDWGREQIESGQRRFLSPEYDVDKNTGEILALYRVSLVAEPGTHRARMLATVNREGAMPDLQLILAALRAALAAEDPAVAKESIANLLAELEKTSGVEPSTEPADSAPTDSVDVTTDAPGPDEGDDKKKPPMAATVAPPPKPVVKSTAGATAVEVKAVASAAGAAVAQIRAAQRDHLIATQGDRLVPSIRRWASAQPLEVVEGLLAATPTQDIAKTRAAATRGVGDAHGLTDRELQKCKARGVDPAKYATLKAASAGGS